MLEQVAQRRCECPIPGRVQGLVGWDSEKPSLVKDDPAQGRGVGTRWFLRPLPNQVILWFPPLPLSTSLCYKICGLNHNYFAPVHRNPLQLQVSFWEKQLSVRANSNFSKFSHGHFTLQAQQLQKMKDSCIPAFIQKLLFPTDLESCISVGDVWYIITAVLGEVQSVTAYTHR